MDLPAAKETVENLRRTAERALGVCLKDNDRDVDLWQHMLDEIALLKVLLED
jgi:hypothetical protein